MGRSRFVGCSVFSDLLSVVVSTVLSAEVSADSSFSVLWTGYCFGVSVDSEKEVASSAGRGSVSSF